MLKSGPQIGNLLNYLNSTGYNIKLNSFRGIIDEIKMPDNRYRFKFIIN